ncbi:MAG TPA: hypothetical protein VIO62_04645 [Candidatus Dormibacteraeota bacterium]|jgi:hypothetical protein
MQEQLTGEREIVPGGIQAWTAALVGGVLLALVSQFLLDSFADSSTIGHWTQHALLFWSGILVGAGVLRLYQLGSRTD